MRKKIILIGPDETARTNIKKHPNICLLARYIKNPSFAVVLKDKLGNISLTQAYSTPHSFLQLEVSRMEGLYTIDIITDGSDCQMVKKMCDFINDEYSEILNSKGKSNNSFDGIRHTKTGTVLITEDKMQTPEEKHIDQILSEKCKKENPLASYDLEVGSCPYFLRYYERLFSIEHCSGPSLPVLVFKDEEWTGKNNELTNEIEKRMQEYHQAYPERFQPEFKIRGEYERQIDLLLGPSDGSQREGPYAYASKELHKLTREYLILKNKSRYSKLYQFFSDTSKEMKPPVIRLMSEYAKEPGLGS